MDAFFVPIHEYDHPYSLRLWCTSTFEGSSYLMTFDGVKIRLFNFLTRRLIKEVDFLKHEALSYLIPVYHHNFPSKAIFIMVRDRRNLMAWDDLLAQVPPLAFDTSLVVLAMAWSTERNTLYVSGNFGWIRALEMQVQTSISGTNAQWIPKWTKHDSGQWMTMLTIDDNRGMLFGASGIDVYIWNLDDGQLLMKFSTLHSMQISSIRYSPDHLLFFTSSADGSIKSWRINEKAATNVHTLKQTPLGPFLMDIDSKSILCISHERVLRRYNMLTGSLLGQLDLDSSVPLENKNLDNPLKLNLAFIGKRNEYLFQSESGKIRSYEVHYAPRELAICCEDVSDIGSLQDGRLVALCKNNIIHVIYTDAQEGQTIDLDRLPIANMPNSKVVPAPANQMIIKGNQIFFGFETGEMKLLDIDNNELYEMREPDIGNCILSVCPSQNMLCKRHPYCSKTSEVKSLLFSSAANGGFTIHCPKCYHFIASWKFTQHPVIQMQQIEDRNLLIGIDKKRLRIWASDDQTVNEVTSIAFDENEEAERFTFASKETVIVALQSGKAAIYELYFPDDEKTPPIITHKFNIRIHDCPISKMMSCLDLLSIEGAEESFKNENLNGIVCSIGDDDSLRIIDCFTGIIQYKTNIPAHIHEHSACFVFQGKIMIALSIDKNIRLFDWPAFVRVVPTPPSSPKPPKTPPKPPSSDEDDKEEESESDSIPYFPSVAGSMRTAVISENISFADSMTTSAADMSSNIGESERSSLYQMPVMEERKKMDLVFENGYPKLLIEGEKPIEVEIENEFSLMDVIRMKEGEKEYDEVLEANRRALEKLIKEDPDVAKAFQTKTVKKIKCVEDEEFDEEQFFSNFLALTTKPIRIPKRKRKQNKEEEDINEKRFSYEIPEEILPIGGRRRGRRTRMYRDGKGPKRDHVIVIEFNDGTKLYANKLTIDVLKKIAGYDDEQSHIYSQTAGFKFVEVDGKPKELTPGLIFSQAIAELNQQEKQKKQWQPIIRSQNMIATPIITMTSDGVTIGGSKHRSFLTRPNEKYDDIYTKFMRTVKVGQLDSNKFMHWEGVNFGQNGLKLSNPEGKKISKIFEINQSIDDNGDEDYDEDEYKLHNTRSYNILDDLFNQLGTDPIANISRHESNFHNSDNEQDDFKPSDYYSIDHSLAGYGANQNIPSPFNANPNNPNSGRVQPGFSVSTTTFGDDKSKFNIFENQSYVVKDLIDTSPSLKVFSEIMGDSDNPLLDLISNQEPMTREEIFARHEEGRQKGLEQWRKMDDFDAPHIDNKFDFSGIGRFQAMDPLNNKFRPASPRPMDALKNITSKMDMFNGTTLLPVISEVSFSDFSDTDEIESDVPKESPKVVNEEPQKEFSVVRREPPDLTPAQAARQEAIKEHLTRKDFKGLKDLLTDVGLLDQYGLVDLPRWQPTVNFMTHHQKATNSSQPINIDLEKWINEGAIKSCSSIQSLLDSQLGSAINSQATSQVPSFADFDNAIGESDGSTGSKSRLILSETSSDNVNKISNQSSNEEFNLHPSSNDNSINNILDINKITKEYEIKNLEKLTSTPRNEDGNIQTNQNKNILNNLEGNIDNNHDASNNETNNNIDQNTNENIESQKDNKLTAHETIENVIQENYEIKSAQEVKDITNNSSDKNTAENIENTEKSLYNNNNERIAINQNNVNNMNLPNTNNSKNTNQTEIDNEEEEIEYTEEKEIIDEYGNKKKVTQVVHKKVPRNSIQSRKNDSSQNGQQLNNSNNNTRDLNKPISNDQEDYEKSLFDQIDKEMENELSQQHLKVNRDTPKKLKRENSSKRTPVSKSNIGSTSDIDSILTTQQREENERMKMATSIVGVAPHYSKNNETKSPIHIRGNIRNKPDDNLVVTGDKKVIETKTEEKKKKKNIIIDKHDVIRNRHQNKMKRNLKILKHNSDEKLPIYEEDVRNVDLTKLDAIRKSYDNLLLPLNISGNISEFVEEEEVEEEEEEEWIFSDDEITEEEEVVTETGRVIIKKKTTRSRRSRPSKEKKPEQKKRRARTKRIMKRKPIVINDEEEPTSVPPETKKEEDTPPKIVINQISEGKERRASAASKGELPPIKPDPNRPYFTGVLKTKQNPSQRPQRTLRTNKGRSDTGSKLSRNMSNDSVGQRSHKSIASNGSEKYDLNGMPDIIEESEHHSTRSKGKQPWSKRKSLSKKDETNKKNLTNTDGKNAKSRKPSGLPPTYDAAREFGINKGLTTKHADDDDDALLDQLLKSTTAAEPISSLNQLGGRDIEVKKTLIRQKTPETRNTALGSKVAIFKNEDDFDSLKLIPHNKATEEVASDLFLSNAKILAEKEFGSQTDLLKKPDTKKKQFFMFSKLDISMAPQVFFSHYCPGIWDNKKGKLRRASV